MDTEGNRIDPDAGTALADGAGEGAPGDRPRARRATKVVWLAGGAAVMTGLLLIPFLGSEGASAQPGPAQGRPGVVWGGNQVDAKPTGTAFPSAGTGQQDTPQQVPEVGSTAPVDGSYPPAAPAKTSPAARPKPPATGRPSRPAPRPAASPQPRPAPKPAPKPAPRPAPKPAPKPRPTYVAVGGEDCHHTTTQGYYRVGTYSDGSSGWYRRSGGWNQNGCRGTFMAMPMSGSATQSDPQAYAVWWFKTGPVTTGQCSVSVYVPTGSARDVAGRPAYYQVVRGEHDMHVVRQFTVDQAANHGRWVNAGSYPVSNGVFALRLVNRGVDGHGEHLAAAQMKVSCHG
jgi:hypothetical protein